MAEGDVSEMSITVSENGPYIVKGNVPLFEMKIVKNDDGTYRWEKVREIEHGPVYALCRCGQSTNAPFCDTKSHKRFRGKEKADRNTYKERAETFDGPGISLMDDGRCSFSRFCHRKGGTAWKLLPASEDPEVREEIIKAGLECPSGRLVAFDGEGEHRPSLEPEIWIIQDPGNNVSSGICVRGGIPLVSFDGYVYERQEQYVLCRCGVSDNRPFCDASHVNYRYKDDRNRK